MFKKTSFSEKIVNMNGRKGECLNVRTMELDKTFKSTMSQKNELKLKRGQYWERLQHGDEGY